MGTSEARLGLRGAHTCALVACGRESIVENEPGGVGVVAAWFGPLRVLLLVSVHSNLGGILRQHNASGV